MLSATSRVMRIWVYESRYGIFSSEGNVFVHIIVGLGCLKWESQVTCVHLQVELLGVRINEKSLSSLGLASGIE